MECEIIYECLDIYQKYDKWQQKGKWELATLKLISFLTLKCHSYHAILARMCDAHSA